MSTAKAGSGPKPQKTSGALAAVLRLYDGVFGALQRAADAWLTGLAARGVFASVLLVYFLDSALTKLGAGVFGFLSPGAGAYAQILPAMTEAAGYNIAQIPFLPYGLIVLLGTWAEFLLPVMIVAGLFTRLASLGMIVFILVMSWVDITGHHVEASTIGMPFDGTPDAMIADQRLLWCFLLLVLVLRGPGLVSLDGLLRRRYRA